MPFGKLEWLGKMRAQWKGVANWSIFARFHFPNQAIKLQWSDAPNHVTTGKVEVLTTNGRQRKARQV